MKLAATAAVIALALGAMACAADSDDDGAGKPKSQIADRDSTQRTRLIGEPILLRFVGARAYVSYTVIFRLSRDPKRPGAPDPRNTDPRVSSTSRGDYKLDRGLIFATDVPILVLGRRSATHCFHGVLPSGSYPSLDRRAAGSTARFVVQPLDLVAGKDKLGTRFVTRAKIHETDIQIQEPAARRALGRLGCFRNALQEYG